MSEKRIISRKMMEGSSKYHFCPFCVDELTKEGKDYKEMLRPLFRVVTAEYLPGTEGQQGGEYLDTHWECPRCKNAHITVRSFTHFYVDWDRD